MIRSQPPCSGDENATISTVSRANLGAGFSLVEVLIAIGVMAIFAMGFASYISYMSKELRYTSQKMESMETRSSLGRLLSDLPTCSCQLSLHASPFDTTATNPTLAVAQIQTGCDPSSPVFIRAGEMIANSGTQLAISALQIQEIESMGVSDRYRGRLVAAFDPNSLVRGMRPIDLEIHFSTDPASPATAKTITTCDFVAGGGGPPLASGSPTPSPTPGPSMTSTCPAGEYVVGISAGTLQCAPVVASGGSSGSSSGPGPIATPVSTPSGPSLSSPGPGCTGHYCITYDFGRCSGIGCRTNGATCTGDGCTACAVGAICNAPGCCAGPACPGC